MIKKIPGVFRAGGRQAVGARMQISARKLAGRHERAVLGMITSGALRLQRSDQLKDKLKPFEIGKEQVISVRQWEERDRTEKQKKQKAGAGHGTERSTKAE